jgi:ATP-dependent helicase/nuclease subunit A
MTFDWISGLYGCTLPPVWNAGQVPLWEKQRIREEAEQRRVLYVGMTRARDRLILSGGILAKRGGDSLLGLLQQIAEGEFGNPEHAFVRVGAVSIPQTVITPGVFKSMRPPLPPSEAEGSIDVVVSSAQWSEREARWQQANQTAAYVTPSLLHQERPVQERGERRQIFHGASQRLGTLMHQLLQRWDFQCAPGDFRDYLADFSQRHLSCESDNGDADLFRELEALLEHFLHTSAYQELRRSTIMGREVPFAVPWPTRRNGHAVPPTCLMEGVMDVVYEIDGEVWVGDYKTDQVSSSAAAQRAEVYREQAHDYATAASQCLGPVVKGCKLFFIRSGEVIAVAL